MNSLSHENESTIQQAVKYAETLAEVFPSPEVRFRLARLYHRTGKHEDAIKILEDIESEGYMTRSLVLFRATVLIDSQRYNEAAISLDQVQERYPKDYELVSLKGLAYVRSHSYRKAIKEWESLIGHPSAGSDLFVNLGGAYSQLAVDDVQAASRAFDYYKKAFELNPKEPSLPMLLVNAGLASNRSKEAWTLVAQVDLEKNPYLRRVPADEGIRTFKEITERQKSLELAYDAGAIPFASLVAHAPRPAWYLWEVKVQMFKSAFDAGGTQNIRTLVGIPSFAEEAQIRQTPPSALVLDLTAVLTLGLLDGSRGILSALTSRGVEILLFDGCIEWLDKEIFRLRMDQLPAYRQRYENLKRFLESNPQSVEIVQRPGPRPASVPAELGTWTVDISLAVERHAYYVDDYVPVETESRLPTDMVRSSSDLLKALVDAGIILDEDARGASALIASESDEKPRRDVDISRPVVMSDASLVGWLESGLLERWLQGSPHERLIIGPWAWREITERVMEGKFYAAALLKAESTREALAEMLAAKQAREVEVSKDEIPQVDIDVAFAEFLRPALSLLSVAKKRGAAVWADDLFLRQVFDNRGLLPEGPWARELEAKVRNALGPIMAVGTQGLVSWLVTEGLISEDSRGRIDEQLFLSGYRIMNTAHLMRWWLMRVPYRHDSPALPYQRLIRDLTQFAAYIPGVVGLPRKEMFARFARISVIPRLIAEVWAAPESGLNDQDRRTLADLLLRISEESL